MKNINWNEVEEAKGFEKLPAGGYICGITAVEDEPDREFLKFEFDIAEGEHKNRFRELYDSKGFWAAKFVKSYKQNALGFFKKMLTAFEKSNKGFVFNNDEKQLKRKLIGLVIGYEEYIGNDGTLKERMIVTDFLSTDDIKAGNFTIPTLKKLSDDDYDKLQDNNRGKTFAEVSEDLSDDDLPF